MAKQESPILPTFTGAHTHPRILGVGSLKNVTGATYHLSKGKQFKIFKRLIPQLKSFILLLEKGHPSAAVDQRETLKAAKPEALEYHELFASSKKEVIETINVWKTKVDAFIIGNQALAIDATKEIVEAAGDTVVISYSTNPIAEGAVGGFVPDDVVLGRMLANSIIDVLINKKTLTRSTIKKTHHQRFILIKKPFTNTT